MDGGRWQRRSSPHSQPPAVQRSQGQTIDRAGAGALRPGRRSRPIPPKLYRMSEIVEYTGVSRQTIHNYTTMGLITERRRSPGGHRLYDESVFSTLDLIEEMKRQNRSLREIRAHLAELDRGG